jgi:hypothetical protein
MGKDRSACWCRCISGRRQTGRLAIQAQGIYRLVEGANKMKATSYRGGKYFRVYVPGYFNEDGKPKTKYFKTKELAQTAITQMRHRGTSTKPQLNERQAAILAMAETEGLTIEQIPEAFRHYRATILNVSKRAHLFELVEKFLERQVHERRASRTIDDDRQRLNKLCMSFENIDVSRLTETGLRQYLEHYPPGSNRRSHYKAVRKFIKWAHESGYLAIDLMARIRPLDQWGVNNEIVPIEDFRRLLFVTAGLEPIEPGEAPTIRYIGLLAYFVLGGLAGMRRAELLRDRNSQSILEWADIRWDKNLISIRDEVAKQTRAADRRRLIPLEPAARDWLLFVKGTAGPVVSLWQSTHTKLCRELFGKLELDLPENGLRNSYASYAQSFRSAGEVAKACGDLESTIRRFYTQLLEPGTGKAWFDIRPGSSPKIISLAV